LRQKEAERRSEARRSLRGFYLIPDFIVLFGAPRNILPESKMLFMYPFPGRRDVSDFFFRQFERYSAAPGLPGV